MAKGDFEVIVFKVLTYLYACLKAGVPANLGKAKEAAGCNDVYWGAVLEDLLSEGLVSGDVIGTWSGKLYSGVRITAKGATYIRENSKMAAARRFLGKAFDAVADAAVSSTFAL